MGVLDGNPKDEPMHYGEIFGVWSYVSNAKCMSAGFQTFKNHIGDGDLKNFVNDLNADTKKEIEECEKLLKDNGIAAPPSFPERPKVNLEDIPVGARFNDPEISAGLVKDITSGLLACSMIIGESIREDVGALFAKYHATKVMHGTRLLRINKEKGWLIPPPLQVKTPEPVRV